MSHFTVLLIGPSSMDEIEAVLAPFEEYPEEGSPYYRFTDKTDELTKEYENSEEYKSKYSSVEQFAEDWYGYRKNTDGKFGTYYNENAKWDRWQVGGRWTGFFKAKKGTVGELGESGAFGNRPDPGYYDHIRKGDIDFEGTRKDVEIEAHAQYDVYENALKGIAPPTQTFAEFRQDYTDIEKARAAWWSQPFALALQNAGIYSYEDYIGGRESYVAKRVDSAYSTYAVIYKGEWVGKGDMGWFGLSNDKVDQSTWNQRLQQLIDDSVDDDTMLTIIDCHI